MRMRSTALPVLLGMLTATVRIGAQGIGAPHPPVDSAMAQERANFRLGLVGSVERNIVDAAEALRRIDRE